MNYTPEERRKYIGSSDISAVLGWNPWKTPLKLWAEKTGEIDPDDLSDNQAVEWGTRLEDVVAQKFAEKHEVKLMAYKKRYVHKDYPYMSCELDRLIVGTDNLVEVKTCNAWAYKDWEKDDEIPVHYILQVQYALGLSGRKKGYFAVLCGGQKYFEKEIEFDQELFDMMIEKARAFWEENVLKKIAPMAMSDDNSDMVNFFPENKTDEIISANEEVNDAIAQRQELSMHIGEMIKEKSEIEAKLKQIIGEATGLETDKYRVTWKKQSKKEYIVKASKTRVMRVSKKKEQTNDK